MFSGEGSTVRLHIGVNGNALAAKGHDVVTDTRRGVVQRRDALVARLHQFQHRPGYAAPQVQRDGRFARFDFGFDFHCSVSFVETGTGWGYSC